MMPPIETQRRTAYEKASLLSRWTFHFFQPMISLASTRTLTPDDLRGQLLESLTTESCYAALSQQWDANLRKTPKKRSSLFWTILKGHGRAMIPILFFRTVRPLLLFSIPALLSLFLEYLDQSQPFLAVHQEQTPQHPVRRDDPGLGYGLALAGAMFAAAVVGAIIQAASRNYSIILSFQTKVALTAMVYRKSLRLSPGARRSSSSGEILQHMSVDADVWTEAFVYLSMWISLPVEIGSAMYLLYRLLGWSFLAGVFAMVLLTPLQMYRASVYGVMRKEKLGITDERVRLTTEVLSAIKVVKLYAWESAFKQKILAIRERELDALRRLGVLFALMSIIFISSTLVICVLTLTVYAKWGGEGFSEGKLTAQTVFVSMTLFSMLRTPISSLSEATTNAIAVLVGTKRIENFLVLEEIQESDVDRRDTLPSNSEDPVVTIKKATFTWTREKVNPSEDNFDDGDESQSLLSAAPRTGIRSEATPTLKDINLSIQRQSLVAVVGRVGEGKSSLLSAMIGEMYKLQGSVAIYGEIAYVPQQPWILNTTLRENILFGKAFQPQRYQQVVRCCGLLPDIVNLPAGDMTEIGERGINLSGGQKQRVSLARAAYQDADIYLFDDPLSAVDAHVDRHLWRNLIGPEGILKEKTRILVTHGIHHLQEVSDIVLIKSGRIVEHGTYDELMARRGIFHQLIREYCVLHRGAHKKDSSSNDGSDSESGNSGDSIATLEIFEEGGFDSETADSVDPKSVAVASNDGSRSRGDLIEEEKMKEGGVDIAVAIAYFKALSYKLVALVVIFHVLAHAFLVSTSLWLKYWISVTQETDGVTNINFKEDSASVSPSLGLFLGVFSFLTLGHVVMCMVMMYTMMVLASPRASQHLHFNLLQKIFRVPPAFFDTTPLGRIINRFSSDIQGIDDRLPWAFVDVVYFSVSLAFSLIIIATTTPAFLMALPGFIWVVWRIQRLYLKASQTIKRIFHVSKSPIYQHFNETLGGLSTIRAMHLQRSFIRANADRVDVHTNAHLAFVYCIRWVEVRLHSLAAVVILLTTLSFVWTRESVDPATAGLALSFALTITQVINWAVRTYCELQNQLVGVERISEYTELETEASERLPLPSMQDTGAIAWPPKQGQIRFHNYSARYRDGLDLVLRNVSFEVQAGEKVGIVGRTGAGKSSLTLALFRMIEAAPSPRLDLVHGEFDSSQTDDETNIEFCLGKIEIDGVDISTLGLADLREAMAIIPQDPVLFAGSIRDNLDPFRREESDQVLWEALERAHLKDHIQSLAGGLDHEVAAGGENFSVGQRSLLCLGRALLRKTRILVLDEATSAVDVETDELIQKTIRSEFKERTQLTIAHRIKTVLDSDRILVMEQGQVAEYDRPEVLLARGGEGSLFFRLARQAGEV